MINISFYSFIFENQFYIIFLQNFFWEKFPKKLGILKKIESDYPQLNSQMIRIFHKDFFLLNFIDEIFVEF